MVYLNFAALLGLSAGLTPPPATDTSTHTYEVVVTATRLARPFRDVPASVTVIPREELELHPSLTTDALLRTAPAVATFRRSSSLVADPTSQGLNLRGIGPSGVSRTLVLLDGAPVNDPFGGWVYWRALPRLGLERIEIVPGAGSALWGSYALGGVANFISRRIEERSLAADVSYGSHDTTFVAARAAGRAGEGGAALEGELLTSSGHEVVAPAARGPIDTVAPSTHGSVNGRFEYQTTPQLRLQGRIGYFVEEQNGGTEFTTASVRLFSFSAGAQLDTGAGALALHTFGAAGSFEQQRARISPDRAQEALAAEQRVPSRDLGGALTFTSEALQLAGRHVLLAGADLRVVGGESIERIYGAGGGFRRRISGGEQQFLGIFVQDLYSPVERLELAVSARADIWRNSDGHRRIEEGAATTDTNYPSRTLAELSPRLGAVYRAADWLSLRAAAYRAFRAPTLNELYRPFQVGTVRTAANEMLEAEHLIGAETGFDLFFAGAAFHATAFWNRLSDPVLNVTLPEPLPDGSERRRENIGAARIAGVEAALDLRIARWWFVVLSYVFVDPKITEYPGSPELIGRDLPQDPRHRGTAVLSYRNPEIISASIQVRGVGPQFEDDRNTLRMGKFFVTDIFVDRALAEGVELFAAVENLFDREYVVGRAGIDTIGQPRMIRAGLRIR